jgi:hypothetical protein
MTWRMDGWMDLISSQPIDHILQIQFPTNLVATQSLDTILSHPEQQLLILDLAEEW